MLHGPASPTAALLAAAANTPPLTPYRGTAPPVSGSAAGVAGAAAAAQGGGVRGGVFRGPQPPLWEQALEQERRLRIELRRKSFWDPDVRRLRSALQGTYEALVFEHYDFSSMHEVEPCLWKAVFYKPIEEFRSRVRALETLTKGSAAPPHPSAAAATSTSPNGAAAVQPPVQLASPEEARAQLARTTSAYLRFLDEALAFYRKTVWKLQWVYGNVGATVDLDAALQNEIQECVPQAERGRVPDVRPSVHRCLIFLGDLCRYQSMALKERPTSARPLWERAMSYYRQAARVQPASGNPYNQMAVMSYYTSDELRAVYFYFRSLAVAMPFATARENLLLLFEKNRRRYGSIAASHAAAALQGGHDADTRAAAGHVADVATRFVRLHGLLFDRINLDSLPDVLAAATRDLENMLGLPGCRSLLQKAPEADQLLFHLAIMNIFAVHNVSASPGPGAASDYAAAAQRAEMRSHALSVAMRFAAAVGNCTASMAEAAAAGGGVGDVDTGFGAVSASCHVMLAWMVSNPHTLTSDPMAASAAGQGAGVGGSEAPEVVAEVAARAAFLAAAARLAAHLSDLTRRRAQDQDWQDPAVRHRSLPEDSELIGFGPLAPVVNVASGWPAASEAPGGAAVLAVRVARMLQALRHLDDALGAPRGPPAVGGPAAWPPTAASATRELSRAVRSFKGAVAQAMTANVAHPGAVLAAPNHGPAPKASISGGGGGPHAAAPAHCLQQQQHHQQQQNGAQAGHPPAHAAQRAAQALTEVPLLQQQPQQPQPQQQLPSGHLGNGVYPKATSPEGTYPHYHQHQQPRNQTQQQPQQQPGYSRSHNLPPDGPAAWQSLTSPFVPPTPGTAHHPPPLPRMLHAAPAATIAAPSAAAAAATGLRTQQQLQQQAPPPGLLPNGTAAAGSGHEQSAAAAAAAAAAGGAVGDAGRPPSKDGGGDDAGEDEIVYQPPRQGPGGLQRPASVCSGLGQMHRRSSSGGGMSQVLYASQDLRGMLSKQPSGGSAAAISHNHSRETSRDGSTLLLRSTSALSTGELITSGGAAGMPPGLMLTCAIAAGGRLSSSGLTSPGSAQGLTLPPSPQQQHLGWDVFGSAGGSGGGGGSTGSGMAPMPASAAAAAAAMVAAAPTGALPARPPSPAVGDLPGAGSIGLLQHLLHGNAVAAGGGSGGAAGAVLFPGGRRASAGAGLVAAGGVAGTAAAASVGVAAAVGGAVGRPGSSGSNVRRASATVNTGQAGGLRVLGLPPAAAGAGGASHPPQVLQLDQSPPQPQLLLSADALAAAQFSGLPASLQHRAQTSIQQQFRQPTSASLLLGGGGPPPHGGAAAAAVGLGRGHGHGPGNQLVLSPGSLSTHPLLPFSSMGGGGGGGGGAGTRAAAFGLPGGGSALVAAGGAGCAHQNLGWPAERAVVGGAGSGGGGMDMSSFFAAAAGNYHATALAEATAEATAVAMADDVLQAMDADDGEGYAGGGGGAGAMYGGAAGAAVGRMYGGGGDDFMDTERFGPAVAAAAGGAAGPGPVTREPSAASDSFFGAAAGGGALGPFPGCSSGSGSGLSLPAAAAAVAAAGTGAAGGGGLSSESMAGLGLGGGQPLGSLEGFGSWGMVPTLPDQLAEYHQRLRRGGGATGRSGDMPPMPMPVPVPPQAQHTGAAPSAHHHQYRQTHQHQQSEAHQQHHQHQQGETGAFSATAGGGGGGGGGGVFGEDLSCLSFLAAHMQRPSGGQGAAGAQG